MGEKLKEIRKLNKLTQIELGEKLGLHQSQIAKYEKGFLSLDSKLIIKICKIFGVSADYLLGLKENIDKVWKEIYMIKTIKNITKFKFIDYFPIDDDKYAREICNKIYKEITNYKKYPEIIYKIKPYLISKEKIKIHMNMKELKVHIFYNKNSFFTSIIKIDEDIEKSVNNTINQFKRLKKELKLKNI